MKYFVVKASLFFIGLFLLFSFSGNAQKDLKPVVPIEKIDELYKKWDNLEKPGIAVGILSNGEIVHTKGYGLANLEYNIPISAETKFYIGKMANQFTVLGILLLEAEGKLRLNDNIQKHLPELSKLGNKISIKDLIQHNSGLRDIGVSKALAGWQEEDEFTLNQAIEFIANQQLSTINTKKHETNHSGFLLLEKIIATISGTSYASFIEKRIFQPLQMTNTMFDDSPGKVIKNIAVGYYPNGDDYRKGVLNQFEMNNTNVYSTVGDICKWERNFLSSNPKVGNVAMFKKMDTPVAINGKELEAENLTMYFGQHQYWDYNGTRKMYNVSMASGYSCKIVRYPEYNFSAVVLGNDGVYNGSTATATSELYVKNYFTKTPPAWELVKVDGIKMDTKTLESFTGDYWEPNALYSRSIYLKNDTLMYARGNGNDSPIIPIGKNKFQMITYSNLFLNFEKEGNEKIMIVEVEGGDSFKHIAYDADAAWTKNLVAYTGEYYCKELNATYHFSLEEDRFIAKHQRLGKVEFSPLLKDSFKGNRQHFEAVRFTRKNGVDVEGFYLSIAADDKLWFQKTPNKKTRNIRLN